MEKMEHALKYLSHYLSAKSKASIHSPFILNFIDNVLKPKSYIQELINIEILRKSLLKDRSTIEVTDLGSGSEKYSQNYSKSIKQIASNHLKSKTEALILYNLANYYKPNNILELGTSLGISTLYLSAAGPNRNIVTIEGSSETAKIAKNNFDKLNAHNIKSLIGPIEENLENALILLEKKPDMIFFDANHRKTPTLDYFNKCLGYSHQKSIFVFDDIYFSKEMKEAWNEIISNSKITLSIDIFFLGIVFFDSNIVKQNVKLRM
jgi:predicted O-methyltransferase YrrM